MTFLLAQRSAMLTLLAGEASKRSTLGTWSPTLMGMLRSELECTKRGLMAPKLLLIALRGKRRLASITCTKCWPLKKERLSVFLLVFLLNFQIRLMPASCMDCMDYGGGTKVRLVKIESHQGRPLAMHSHHHPSGSHSKENGHSHHHQHSHHHHHHDHLHTEIDLGAQVESSLLQRRYGSFWQNIRKEIGPLIGQAQSRRFVFLLVANLICSVLLFSWCDSTNSIALEAYSYTIWFNFLSLLTSLLSLWVSAKGPSHYYTLGYERFEVLAVFASTVLAQLGALLVAKESVERLLEQPDIHTGRLLLGGGVAFGSHLLVLYGSRNPALEHVMGAASSSWLQDHVSDLSHTLCSAMPPLRSLLLPRINPMLLVSLAGFLSILLTNLLIEIRDYHMMDTLAAFVIIIVTCATMFPMSVYSGKVLLQTTPAHIVGQLDKCLRETLTIDGVLEFRNEHFWTLSFGKLAGSLHVRVRRDADEQKVLAQVIARLSPIVPVLRVQVVKDDWQHSSSSLFSSPQVAFPPSPFTSVQPNNNLLFSGVTSLDPDKFPFKPH